jgi:hypothetical protein
LKKFAVVLIIIISLLLVAGCTSRDGEYRKVSENTYYFEYTGDQLQYNINQFLVDNPNLTLSSMAPDDRGVYGSTVGYYITFEENNG